MQAPVHKVIVNSGMAVTPAGDSPNRRATDARIGSKVGCATAADACRPGFAATVARSAPTCAAPAAQTLTTDLCPGK